VTRKITNSVAKIKLGLETSLTLGNLEAKRDWGYAPDFVEAMWLMLQQNTPDSFVIATSESHSVREFVELAFSLVDLDWTKYVQFNQACQRPLDIDFLRGDCSKAQICLGWSPKVKFAELVDLMVREDLTRWQRWSNGEKFSWDAPNYPNETQIPAKICSIN
jgi:GDPmannose 4,6-dehydratase